MKKNISIILLVLVVVIGGIWWLNSSSVMNDDTTPETTQPNEEIVADNNTDGSAATGADRNVAVPSLTGNTWVWQKTIMNDGAIITPAQSATFTLSFTAEGSLSGTTDCNNFMGSYELVDSTLTAGPLAMTKMYCEGSQEQVFVSVFNNPVNVFFDESQNLVLLLPYDSGSVIFAPQI